MQIANLIIGLIAIGMCLAASGELGKATKYLAKMAVEAQKSDSISLRDWNNSLMGEKVHRPKPKGL